MTSRPQTSTEPRELRAGRRKLMLLTYYFPPVAASAVHRWVGLSRHLVELGWDVVAVAPTAVRFEPNDPSLLSRLVPGIEVERTPFPDHIGARLAARAFAYEQWLPAGWRLARSVVARHKPDVVLSTSPPGAIHALGYGVKRMYGLPWIADFRDPLITNLRKYERTPLHEWLDRRAERRTMRWADRILANTPHNLAGLQRAYPDAADRMLLLTNGFDPVALPAPEPRAAGQDIVLLHAGEFYAGRDPRTLLECIAAYNHAAAPGASRFRLKLLGRTDCGFDLPAFVRDKGLADAVDIMGQVPHGSVLSQTASADILVSIQGPGYQNSIPAKLYEYIAFGKPVLQLADPGGDIDWVLATSKVPHRVVSQTDAAGIASALNALAAAVTAGSSASAVDGAEVFTRSHLARLLAAELDAIASKRANT